MSLFLTKRKRTNLKKKPLKNKINLFDDDTNRTEKFTLTKPQVVWKWNYQQVFLIMATRFFFFFKGGKRIYLKMRLVLLIGDTEIVWQCSPNI